MPALSCCAVCSGFVPAFASACPHCDTQLPARAPARRSRWSRLRRALFRVAGGGAVAVTLMACYGAPPRHRFRAPAPGAYDDADGDGSRAGQDCNDFEPTVHPGAPDPAGDGIDQNCDGADGMAPPRPAAPGAPADPPAEPAKDALAPVP